MTRLMSWRDDGGEEQVGAVIIVMTRWHEDDLVGRLLSVAPEGWEVLNLPAIQDDPDVAAALGKKVGDALWPEMYPLSFLEQQRMLNPLAFACLYQGKPTAEEGDVFRKEWFRTYRTPPEGLRRYMSGDFAVTTKTRSDKTAIVVSGMCSEGNIYILDVVWRKMDAQQIVSEFVRLVKKWKPETFWGEKGQIASTIGPFLDDALNKERAWVYQDLKAATQDKRARAQSIRGLFATGRVFLPERAPWYADAVAEMLSFPNGKHDDLVDALSWLGLGVSRMTPGRAPGVLKRDAPQGMTMGQLLEAARKRHQSGSRVALF